MSQRREVAQSGPSRASVFDFAKAQRTTNSHDKTTCSAPLRLSIDTWNLFLQCQRLSYRAFERHNSPAAAHASSRNSAAVRLALAVGSSKSGSAPAPLFSPCSRKRATPTSARNPDFKRSLHNRNSFPRPAHAAKQARTVVSDTNSGRVAHPAQNSHFRHQSRSEPA
jgi:hypothetical protein